jgi:hypothetical protein
MFQAFMNWIKLYTPAMEIAQKFQRTFYSIGWPRQIGFPLPDSNVFPISR